jgi:glutamate-5-semialdehyde dehydrogenase
MDIQQMTQAARQAAGSMATLSSEIKNRALQAVGAALVVHADRIVAANAADLRRSQEEGLAQPLLKRLKFDRHKLDDVVSGIDSLAGLPDPVGRTLLTTRLDDGLDLYRVSCPIGVIGVIFESRPDALVQISTLCLKSGNAVLLKGGSEAMETNRILTQIIADAGRSAGLPDGWIGLLETRLDVGELLKQDETVDLLIPRGSNEFVRYIMDHTRIPVLGHADGVCHLYIDEAADPAMAVRTALDSKTQYVAVCNAVETILLHQQVAATLLAPLAAALKAAGVTIFGCARTCAILGCQPVQDWHTEYLDYKVSIKIVADLADAVLHINRFGSHHTDAIVTENAETARRFLVAVDSGNVFWNCSTRFSDGFRYGFGAEVGISTSKIHARGPVGLDGLVTYQYRLLGHGQIVADYASGQATFKHEEKADKYPFER